MRSKAPAEAFAVAASDLGVPVRVIDLATVRLSAKGVVSDQAGPVTVTHLMPGLMYGEPHAGRALAALTIRGVKTLNHLEGVSTADDKVLTARALEAHAVPQPAWRAVQAEQVDEALELGLPLILKRPYGALGMWVARITDAAQLDGAARHLLREGGDRLLAQAEVSESLGQAIRVVVLTDQVLAATVRTAAVGEWRSNVARGGTQQSVELSQQHLEPAVPVVNKLLADMTAEITPPKADDAAKGAEPAKKK